MRKAVFLDRDGLINRKAAEHDYIKRWDEFSFLPNVPAAITKLNQAGYLVLIITNQRGIARGLMSAAALQSIHEKMCAELESWGAHIDGIYVCPHDIGQCNCRKPDIGLFLQAECDFAIDKKNSWMVGDSQSDVDAGTNYGIKAIQTTKLPDAVEQILEDAR
ncbi:MAG: HAD family hydrolase [Oscillospiraceae bacterium]|nr:HAD family hydrolase [Oscillospiraceae bacterium]